MAAAKKDAGMDFHKAFQAIDTDDSGEITVEELQEYCRKMNYKEVFVQKWLMLFDEDQNGRITYDEYCNTLGLVPKQEVVEKHSATAKKPAEKGKKQQETTKEETRVTRKLETTTETVSVQRVAPLQSKEEAPASRRRVRNQQLNGSGLMRYSRARMFERKALYKFAKRSSGQATKSPASAAASASTMATSARPSFVEKPIGGDNNGESRRVATRRQPKSLQTCSRGQRRRRQGRRATFAGHRRRLRASIASGCVLIMLAGRHRGKRVVFLRQLPSSGLLLVTGPLRLNGCPLRRVSQRYVIATSLRLRLDSLRLPERLNDAYFRRAKKSEKGSSTAAAGEELFAKRQQKFELRQERRDDQKEVDSQIMAAITEREDKKLLAGYLRSLFSLKRGDRPHAMRF